MDVMDYCMFKKSEVPELNDFIVSAFSNKAIKDSYAKES